MTGCAAIRPLAIYLLRSVLGARLVLGLALTMVASAALALFLGGTALVEQRQFAAVLTANAARIVVVLSLVLITCFHIRRAFEAREVDILLSRPIARRDFVLAHVLMLVLLAAAAAVLAGIAVAALARPTWAALACWTLSVFVEGTIVAVTALFLALMLTGGVASTLACLGFYVLGRMIGVLSGIAAAASHPGPIDGALDQVVAVLALVLPRLDLFGRSAWLVHGLGDETGVGLALLQGALYVLLLGAAASFDFGRRQL
jgi:hypothetical protein